MEYRELGKTGLQISSICLGTMNFSNPVSEGDSIKMLHWALDSGINFIDTADVYSRWADGNEGGESEKIIGKWMKERQVRDKITLATKVGSDMGQGQKNISKNYILKAFSYLPLRVLLQKNMQIS